MPITSAPPPSRGTSNVSSTTRVSPRKTKEREEIVASLGMFAQLPLLATKQYADAGAITQYWPTIAKELAELAETQEPIARVIDPLLQVGPFAGLIAAVLPLAMQLAVNHGRIKPGALGTVPATTLASQVETSMALQDLQAAQLQLEAEKQAAAAKQEINEARAKLRLVTNDDASEG